MLLEYQLDWIKILDFLLMAKFLASPDNYATPSMNIYPRQWPVAGNSVTYTIHYSKKPRALGAASA